MCKDRQYRLSRRYLITGGHVTEKKALMGRLADNNSDEPEWFRKYIILRAESEGISYALAKEMKPDGA